MLKQLDAAVAADAHIDAGGKRMERRGFFLPPTIPSGVEPSNPAFHQEFFAPVATMFRVKSDDEAISLANDSPNGLGGSIITADIERGKPLASRIDTGMVSINESRASAPELPFGGVKNSGFGRELSDLGVNEFVNKKLIKVAPPLSVLI